MLITWYLIVAVMIAAYVVLDGFDLGVGVLHLLVARTEDERKMLIRSISPVWDGNEVWLLASGGTLYFAFPLLYASGFGGFYLPLMIVLWLLILRGVGIELRSHVDSSLWRQLFGAIFGIGSLLLTIFFGAALGNVIRGVPLQADHYFFLPLWTDWRTGPQPGILDWYTVIAGVVASVSLTLHGANYAAIKTSGALNNRVKNTAKTLWPALLIVTLVSLAGTLYIRPELLDNYRNAPVLYVIPLMVVASLGMMRSRNERTAFLASSAYLVFMLLGAVAAVYPNLLTSTTDPALNITVSNAHSGDYSLSAGLIWWSVGMLIALGYFTFLYRTFRGKILESSSDPGQ